MHSPIHPLHRRAFREAGRGILLATLCGAIAVQADLDLSPERQANLKRVEALQRGRQVAHGSADDMYVRRGVLADRENRRVLIDAEATGLEAQGIVEFPVIAENSGHDYEALFTSFAKPGDISAALEFIGVPRGRPAQPESFAFWPKGERVHLRVLPRDKDPIPIEDLILDARHDHQPLPRLGLIHAGSVTVERDGTTIFAADQEGPGSVVSTYNEPTTVLDMPRQAHQSEVYERFLANPALLFPKGEFVQLELTPEDRPETSPYRVVDRRLAITAPEGAVRLGEAVFRLSAPDEAEATDPVRLTDALQALRAYRPEQDPYVTLDWDDSVPLRAAAELARVLDTLDTEDGLRIEAPKAEQLYYRAFLPRAEWRDRMERPTQPCELRFNIGENGGVGATLVHIEEIWDEDPDNWRPTLRVHPHPLDQPEQLPERLEATGVRVPVMLVFAPGDLTLGDIMPYLRTVQSTHPNLHVFLEE